MKSYLETTSKSLEGFSLNLLLDSAMCESENVLICLGDRAGTLKTKPVQCFQLICLFSEDEKGKIQISTAFKLQMVAVFRGCQMFFPEYQERYRDDQFWFINCFFFIIIIMLQRFLKLWPKIA